MSSSDSQTRRSARGRGPAVQPIRNPIKETVTAERRPPYGDPHGKSYRHSIHTINDHSNSQTTNLNVKARGNKQRTHHHQHDQQEGARSLQQIQHAGNGRNDDSLRATKAVETLPLLAIARQQQQQLQLQVNQPLRVAASPAYACYTRDRAATSTITPTSKNTSSHAHLPVTLPLPLATPTSTETHFSAPHTRAVLPRSRSNYLSDLPSPGDSNGLEEAARQPHSRELVRRRASRSSSASSQDSQQLQSLSSFHQYLKPLAQLPYLLAPPLPPPEEETTSTKKKTKGQGSEGTGEESSGAGFVSPQSLSYPYTQEQPRQQAPPTFAFPLPSAPQLCSVRSFGGANEEDGGMELSPSNITINMQLSPGALLREAAARSAAERSNQHDSTTVMTPGFTSLLQPTPPESCVAVARLLPRLPTSVRGYPLTREHSLVHVTRTTPRQSRPAHMQDQKQEPSSGNASTTAVAGGGRTDGQSAPMRVLRRFVREHVVDPSWPSPSSKHASTLRSDLTAEHPAPRDDGAAPPPLRFSEEETHELQAVLTQLQLFVSTSLSYTQQQQTAPESAVQQALTGRDNVGRAKGVGVDSADAKYREAGDDPAVKPEEKMLPESTDMHGSKSNTRKQQHSSSPQLELEEVAIDTATDTHADAMRLAGAEPPRVEPDSVAASNDGASVERRYRAVLENIQGATDDVQVALRRVSDYSASLSVLVQTWMDLRANNFEAFAHTVLQRMLDDNPSYQVLFYGIDVRSQSFVIMDMIGRAVVAFTRPADLVDIMAEMGARHNLYCVGEEQYTAMCNAFLQTYAAFVEPETYNRSVGVWKMFWKTTIELSMSGASGEQGKMYRERRNMIWAERVQVFLDHIIPRQRSGGFHRLLQVTYQRAVAKHSELQRFHQFADLRTAHRAMEAVVRIAKRVVHGGGAAAVVYNAQLSIQNLFEDPEAIVDAAVMQSLEESFLEACEFFSTAESTTSPSTLEAETSVWNPVVRVALQELWSVYITGFWTARPVDDTDGGMSNAAPDGSEPFCLMFTDIEASTRLWAADPEIMGQAIHRHHKVVRGLIEDFVGYEVKTVGDSFVIATRHVTKALLIALGIQVELMTEPSAPGFHMPLDTQGTGDATCWRDDALRVRVGIHYCADASAVYDSVHRRFDYYGPGVNCAARVEGAACGGQVLLSYDAYAQLCLEEAFNTLPANELFVEQLDKFVLAQEARGMVVEDPKLKSVVAAVHAERHTKVSEMLPVVPRRSCVALSVAAATTIADLIECEDGGFRAMKGIAEPVQVYSILPAGLTGRVFSREHSTAGSLFGIPSLRTPSQTNDAEGVSLPDRPTCLLGDATEAASPLLEVS